MERRRQRSKIAVPPRRERVQTTAIMLPASITRALDTAVAEGHFESRSHAVRKACQQLLRSLEPAA